MGILNWAPMASLRLSLSLQESHIAFLSQEIMFLDTVLVRALQKDRPYRIYGSYKE